MVMLEIKLCHAYDNGYTKYNNGEAMRFSRWLYLAMMAMILGIGCSIPPKELEEFDITLMAYERHIRWGNFTTAHAMHLDATPLSDLENRRLKMYRVTGYKTMQREMVGTTRAFVTSEISYYHNERAIERSLIHKQEWEYNKELKRWFVKAPFPSFR